MKFMLKPLHAVQAAVSSPIKVQGKKLRGLIPQAKYTDRATAACRRSQCQTFAGRECIAWSAQQIPTAVNFGYLDRSRYFFIQVAPQLSSRGWVGPVSDPILLRKCGRAGNRIRDLWICSQKLWPQNHRGGLTSVVSQICGPRNIPSLLLWPDAILEAFCFEQKTPTVIMIYSLNSIFH
jgi:hypothetical protein